jgi:hypothetical protein
MVTAKTAPGLSLALHHAAGHAPAVHAPGGAVLLLAVIVLAAGGWLLYRVSLWLHPFRMCRRCGGSGIVSGFLPWSKSFCGHCGGRGLVPRLGTTVGGLRGRHPR